MPRFSFSSPGSRGDDAWFRVGSVEVTTTILIVGLGVVSMLVWALDPGFTASLAFLSPQVRAGELWRVVTWPVGTTNVDLWTAIGLFFLYFIGRELERLLGKNRFLGFIGLIVVIPAVIAIPLNLAVAGMSYVSMPCFVGLAMIYPQARSFFNIPLWVIAAVFVGIQVIQFIGYRDSDGLIFFVVTLAVGLLALRSFGVLDAAWLPKIPLPTRKGKRKAKRKLKAVPNPDPGVRPAGPRPGDGLRQAELDMLLDKIAAEGIESLTREERRRLDEASRRLRDEKG